MIGLIVDGEGDYSAFRARYRGQVRVMKCDGPRGHLVSERALVEGAKRQIGLLRDFGCTRIAIVTDFEGRGGSLDSFCKAFEKQVQATTYANGISFFVADRMIENWFLADVAYLSSKKAYLRAMKKQKSYESTHGKAELKKLFVQGADYNEVRHGAELFSMVRGADAARFSPSFARFRHALGLD